jgi:hypothetical protein
MGTSIFSVNFFSQLEAFFLALWDFYGLSLELKIYIFPQLIDRKCSAVD